MVLFLNIIILLTASIFIFNRYKKYRQFQLLDILMLFYILFFPIGLIRPALGYSTIIEYDMFKNIDLLEKSSWIVLFFLIAFIIGCVIGNFGFKRENYIKLTSLRSPLSYRKLFKNITYFNTLITVALMLKFLNEQGSIAEYFRNIDSIRQTLSGQMGNYTIIYLNVLLSLYCVLLNKKFITASKIGILVSILFFAIYGFRGFVLSILIVTFFVTQKLQIFKINLNFKNLVILLTGIYLFVFFQDIREISVQKEPIFLKLITRFSGYESVMVVYDKTVERGMYSFDTFYTNFISFLQLPIPRTLFHEKIKPVSILFTEKLFYDVGYRDFDTGGISPTIVGSLIWNFHLLGIFFMFLFGAFSAYVERKLRNSESSFKILIFVSISLYLIMAIEYPENFAGILWMLFIGLSVIYFLSKFITKSIW